MPAISRYVQFHGTRDEQLARLRAEGWQILTYKGLPLVVAFRELGDKIHAKAWRDSAAKPAWYYTFRSLKNAEIYVQDFAGQVRRAHQVRTARDAERKTKRANLKASDHYTVGDVLYNSWGYDQTNIDWYQVVEVKARSIVIREIGANSSDHGGPSGGMSAPRRNHFTGEPMLKPLGEDGHVCSRHGWTSKWDGRAKGCSSYH